MRTKPFVFILSVCLACLVTGCGQSADKSDNASADITQIDQLDNTVMAIHVGGMVDQLVNSRLPGTTFTYYQNSIDACLAVQKGKELSTAGDLPAMRVTVAQMDGLKILPEMLTHDQYGMAVSLGNYALKNSLDSLLKALKADGRYDRLCERWFPEQGVPEPMPVFDFDSDAPALRLGTSAITEPFSYLNAQRKVVGFDIEIVSLLAQALGMKLELLDMDFGGLIPALMAKKVDIIAGCITMSEERAKNVLFSDSYYSGGICAVVRDTGTDAEQVKGFIPHIKKIGQSIGDSFYNNIIKEKRYVLLWQGLLVTCVIAICAALLGTLIGMAVCAMRLSKKRFYRDIALIYTEFFRGIPQVVLLMIMFYVVFASSSLNGVVVASLTFALNFSAYVSEIFRSALAGIPKGQREAGTAIGFSKFQTFRYIILPQTVVRALPVYKSEFISMVKMTSVVGYIAVQDLTKASDIIRSRTFDAFFPLITVAILYFFIAWLLSYALKIIEIRVTPKRK